MNIIENELRNGTSILPKSKRKTILLLSDDLRMSSGIATVSKELVFGMLHRFNIVQLGAAINHPEQGKELDLNDDVRQRTGIADAELRIIPWPNYGDANVLRQLIMRFNPDAILHFTDPRYFKWLYEMEAEVRQHCPILYYTIWDNVGTPDNNFATDPLYNKAFYASCDGLFCISKQTFGAVNRILKKGFDDEFDIINN